MKFPIYQIGVQRQGAVLTIDTPELAIGADAAVEWLIEGVEDDETAQVLIPSNRVSELGPFTFSRAGGGSILVRGSSGFGGAFTYQIAIYDLAGGLDRVRQVAVSAPAQIDITSRPQAGKLGQTILVTYDPHPAPIGQLVVDQLETRFVSGDPVVFELHLPADIFSDAWLPSLYFKNAPPSPNRGHGPFAALSVVDGADVAGRSDGTLRRFLIATGASGLVGRFTYEVVVRSIGGIQYVSSQDPVLDNDGEVVCPGCV